MNTLENLPIFSLRLNPSGLAKEFSKVKIKKALMFCLKKRIYQPL